MKMDENGQLGLEKQQGKPKKKGEKIQMKLGRKIFIASLLSQITYSYHIIPHSNYKKTPSSLPSHQDRRSCFNDLASMALIPLTLLNPPAANAGEMRGDVELTPLNSLAFNYRESTSAASPTPAGKCTWRPPKL
jgi:hypothetical protein